MNNFKKQIRTALNGQQHQFFDNVLQDLVSELYDYFYIDSWYLDPRQDISSVVIVIDKKHIELCAIKFVQNHWLLIINDFNQLSINIDYKNSYVILTEEDLQNKLLRFLILNPKFQVLLKNLNIRE